MAAKKPAKTPIVHMTVKEKFDSELRKLKIQEAKEKLARFKVFCPGFKKGETVPCVIQFRGDNTWIECIVGPPSKNLHFTIYSPPDMAVFNAKLLAILRGNGYLDVEIFPMELLPPPKPPAVKKGKVKK